ncbi:MAG TPA: hypothetical protein VHM29_10930 [Acidimicrobiia bacterium]|nr:hypothetical protein [Acidimicrobiia bacterium]
MRTAASRDDDLRADRVAGWATGVGAGLVVFMVSWQVWSRVLTGILSTPDGPVAAMIGAVLSGAGAMILMGRRLAGRFR